MTRLVRSAWAAVRPETAQQRFVWFCGALLLASGLLHGVVAVVDGGSWWGPVSWRKPVVFALSFAAMLWTVGWILRVLPPRRWAWLPVATLAVSAVAETALITLQQWRGVPSHFNPDTPFDEAIFSLMGNTVGLIVLATTVLWGWSALALRRDPVMWLAIVGGLTGVLVGGYIGVNMIAVGDAEVQATGHVPFSVVFGAEGSAKLAHATGLHGLQLLAGLAILLTLGRLSRTDQVRTMLLAVAGYAAVFGAIATTAYAGRAWTQPTAMMGLLGGLGLVALLVAGTAAVRGAWRPVASVVR